MPSMKKKTSYEQPPGLMRRFLKKGASFRSLGAGESLNDSGSSFGKFGNSEKKKWRPRKNKFELLDGDDDESLSAAFQEDSFAWSIQHVVSSSESDPAECKRGIMFEQKANTIKRTPIQSMKRGLSPIKPPCNDTTAVRAPSSSSKKFPQKAERNGIEWSGSMPQDDLKLSRSNTTTSTAEETFLNSSAGSFGFGIEQSNSNGKSEESFPLSSRNPVVSDPFSTEQDSKLTSSNLAKIDATPNKTDSVATGMEKLVKERKFYQFAIDEDKTSTVVESTIQLPADYPGGQYSFDDATQMSCDETSQGTRIQQRSVASQRKQKQNESNDILPSSSHSRKHANEVKAFDAFFTGDTVAKKDESRNFDELFPSSIDKDGFFPDYGRPKESQHIPPTPGTDLSSFGVDYFDPRHTSANTVGQASSKSLAYSISPVHQMKSPAFVAQNTRQPLSSKNPRRSSGRKSNEWFASKNTREREPQFQFNDFPVPPSSSMKKRHSSIGSSNFQAPPTDPFESPANKYGAKENFTSKGYRHEAMRGAFGANPNKQNRHSFQRPLQRPPSYDDTDPDEDDDAFDDVVIKNWGKSAQISIGNGVTLQDRTFAINRARINRYSSESYNRPSKNRYLDDDCDDDARSVASGFEITKKPMGLPSNAIMASMLFQTQQYGIDQNDVTAKINAIERENSRNKRVRTSQGGIPDAVHTDDDYMTTVSSFSDATSAYLQEPWKKPSTDLMNHFTSARALDMEYRRVPVRTQRVEHTRPHRVLYEA